jgi:hypothetical protein
MASAEKDAKSRFSPNYLIRFKVGNGWCDLLIDRDLKRLTVTPSNSATFGTPYIFSKSETALSSIKELTQNLMTQQSRPDAARKGRGGLNR